MSGVELIAQERARQVGVEGWTPEHDEEHCNGELAEAAACYAALAAEQGVGGHAPTHSMPASWPWDASWWKPRDRLSNLVRAGALVAAEIDRIQRAEARAETPHGE